MRDAAARGVVIGLVIMLPVWVAIVYLVRWLL